jgi:hypothetical protein
MSDFDFGTIEVRYNSTDYGPFSFDLEDAAPTGAVIAVGGVTVNSYEGNVKAGDLLSAETETSDELVDALLTGSTGDYTVGVYFNYPGVDYEGNHTLFFEITWDNGAVHSYVFYKVKVV